MITELLQVIIIHFFFFFPELTGQPGRQQQDSDGGDGKSGLRQLRGDSLDPPVRRQGQEDRQPCCG